MYATVIRLLILKNKIVFFEFAALQQLHGVFKTKVIIFGGDETRLGYVQYVQGIQPNIPARTACRHG